MDLRNGIRYRVIRSGIIQKKDGGNACSICLLMRRLWIKGSKLVQRTYIGGDGSNWYWIKKEGGCYRS